MDLKFKWNEEEGQWSCYDADPSLEDRINNHLMDLEVELDSIFDVALTCIARTCRPLAEESREMQQKIIRDKKMETLHHFGDMWAVDLFSRNIPINEASIHTQVMTLLLLRAFDSVDRSGYSSLKAYLNGCVICTSINYYSYKEKSITDLLWILYRGEDEDC